MPRRGILRSVALVAILAATFVAVAWVSGLAASTEDQSKIVSTITTRLTWIQGFGGTSDGRLASDTTLEKAQAAARATLDTLYTGALLDTRVKQIDGALQEQATGDLLMFGGGVDKLEIKSVVVEGDKATVVADATTWSDLGQQKADGSVARSRPTNSEEFTFHLVRVGTAWLIADEDLVFAPGDGP
jgi:hypothetical protein